MFLPGIFHNLLNFSYQRTGFEAAGFYIAYLVISVMVGALAGTGIALLTGSSETRVAWHVDAIAASILFLMLSYMFIRVKQLGGGMLFWLIPLGAAVATIFLTHFAGALVPTILSTLPKKANTPPPSGTHPNQTQNDPSRQSEANQQAANTSSQTHN